MFFTIELITLTKLLHLFYCHLDLKTKQVKKNSKDINNKNHIIKLI
jgi:hypothetical protein